MKFTQLQKLILEYGINDLKNPDPASKKVSLVIGRFQPFHAGHNKLVENASYPVILGIVKGKMSSLVKIRNPFPLKLQKEVAQTVNKNIVDVMEFENASLDVIMDMLRDKGYELVEVLAGTDRVKAYQAMAKNYLNTDKVAPTKRNPEERQGLGGKVKVKEIKRTEQEGKKVTKGDIATYSASAVREALKQNDVDLVKAMLPNVTDKLIKKLQKEL